MKYKTKISDSGIVGKKLSDIKTAILIPVAVALIAALSAIGGNYVGQRTSAVSETDKIVREKLEMAFYRLMSYSDLAVNFNLAAASAILPPSEVNIAMIKYNDEGAKYRDQLQSVASILDMYSDDLDVKTKNLLACSKAFTMAAGNLFMLNVQLSKIGAYGTPTYVEAARSVDLPSRQNAVAAKRVECEGVAFELRQGIKMEVKKHLAKSIL